MFIIQEHLDVKILGNISEGFKNKKENSLEEFVGVSSLVGELLKNDPNAIFLI